MSKPEIVNNWIKVKITKSKGDGFYTTNQCPVCDAESLVQTNACPNCGAINKGYVKECNTCRYGHCDFDCKKCALCKGKNKSCVCVQNMYNDKLCVYYEPED